MLVADSPDLPPGHVHQEDPGLSFHLLQAQPDLGQLLAVPLTDLHIQVHDRHHGVAADQAQADLGQLLAVPLTDLHVQVLKFPPDHISSSITEISESLMRELIFTFRSFVGSPKAFLRVA